MLTRKSSKIVLASPTLTIGAPHPIVDEPIIWAETYPIEWRKPRRDLAEPAVLRWFGGGSRRMLAARYGRVLRVTESRVSQLHAQAVSKLRTRLVQVLENEELDIV
jgi:hypothetical protein